MSLFPKRLFTNFAVLHSAECHIGEPRLTQWIPLDLFGHQAKHMQQLHHYFHDQFDHRSFKSDFRINFKPVHELFDLLEQFGERVVAGTNVLCRLVYLDDTWIHKREVKDTYTK
jgi:hypothetical protein